MKILIADDAKDVVELLKTSLEKDGHTVVTAFEGDVRHELIQKEPFDFAFLDHDMPEVTGLDIIKYVKKNNIPMKTIMITGHDKTDWSFADAAGAEAYLSRDRKRLK